MQGDEQTVDEGNRKYFALFRYEYAKNDNWFVCSDRRWLFVFIWVVDYCIYSSNKLLPKGMLSNTLLSLLIIN
jgi:hypothetical protein